MLYICIPKALLFEMPWLKVVSGYRGYPLFETSSKDGFP
jgi:hypothetical protein